MFKSSKEIGKQVIKTFNDYISKLEKEGDLDKNKELIKKVDDFSKHLKELNSEVFSSNEKMEKAVAEGNLFIYDLTRIDKLKDLEHTVIYYFNTFENM